MFINNFSFVFLHVKKVKSDDLGFGIIDAEAFPPTSSGTWHVQCLLETSLRVC